MSNYIQEKPEMSDTEQWHTSGNVRGRLCCGVHDGLSLCRTVRRVGGIRYCISKIQGMVRRNDWSWYWEILQRGQECKMRAMHHEEHWHWVPRANILREDRKRQPNGWSQCYQKARDQESCRTRGLYTWKAESNIKWEWKKTLPVAASRSQEEGGKSHWGPRGSDALRHAFKVKSLSPQ